VQSSLMNELGDRIAAELGEGHAAMDGHLEEMNHGVSKVTQAMATETTASLVASSERSMQLEIERQRENLAATFRGNAETLVELLAAVAVDPILSKNYSSLLAYVKAASRGQDVVCVSYFNALGRPLTRFLDDGNSKIQSYTEGVSPRDRIGAVWEKAEQDEEVFVVERPIVASEQVLGSCKMIVDRRGYLRQTDEVAERMRRTAIENAGMIESRLGEESGRVMAEILRDSQHLAESNLQSRKAVGEVLRESVRRVLRRTRTAMLAVGAGIVLCLVALTFFMVRHIVVKPIRRMGAVAERIAKGDLRAAEGLAKEHSQDEVGALAGSLSVMNGYLVDVIRDVSVGVETLSHLGEELSTASGGLAEDVSSIGARSSLMASAAEEFSITSADVAQSMNTASQSVQTLAGAGEEISSTIADVAQHAERARVVSADARQRAGEVGGIVERLEGAACEIGQVTDVISGISEQTNLLALNATIEAARAGAAGKGFAVVAGEIKELARQTATATGDIKKKIDLIQASTASATRSVQDISEVVNDVAGIVQEIERSIGEQVATIREMACDISRVSGHVGETSERIEQTASVARSMAQEIGQVDQSIGGIREKGARVAGSAGDLLKLTSRLGELAARFTC
jgi:methyl-accepting chemotaxis protein